MAESQSWQERLAEARQRCVFEPTPSGVKPYNAPLERLCSLLDQVEVTSSIAAPDSPTRTLCSAMAAVLREMINAREYERNMHTRLEVGPDRLDDVERKLDTVLTALAALATRAGPTT